MKIAVLVNETGLTAGFSEKAELYLYERTGDTWGADQKLDWTPGNHESMAGLRFCLSQMVDWLGECKVIAAGPTHGFYRVIFEGFGVALWMIEGRPQDFIPQIEHFYGHRHAVAGYFVLLTAKQFKKDFRLKCRIPKSAQ